jgi:5,10-methenyltetrahydrofolate synthetase
VSLGWTISDATDKAALRKRMRKLRLVADQKEGPVAALAVLRHAIAGIGAIGVGEGSVVAGYWPLGTEIDIRPLLARLCECGAICSLPVIVEDGLLAFRRWQPDDSVEEGERGTMHPRADAPVVDPEFLFVPILAVDDQGCRLGQGGGYYDRTLQALRARHTVTAIGVGYTVQHVDRLPREALDQPMDWILTEAGLTQVRA